MLNGYLNHTDREEGWIQQFQNLMECKNNYRKLMLLFDLLHHLLYLKLYLLYPVFNFPFDHQHQLFLEIQH